MKQVTLFFLFLSATLSQAQGLSEVESIKTKANTYSAYAGELSIGVSRLDKANGCAPVYFSSKFKNIFSKYKISYSEMKTSLKSNPDLIQVVKCPAYTVSGKIKQIIRSLIVESEALNKLYETLLLSSNAPDAKEILHDSKIQQENKINELKANIEQLSLDYPKYKETLGELILLIGVVGLIITGAVVLASLVILMFASAAVTGAGILTAVASISALLTASLLMIGHGEHYAKLTPENQVQIELLKQEVETRYQILSTLKDVEDSISSDVNVINLTKP